MKFQQRTVFLVLAAGVFLFLGGHAFGQELRVQCYSDGNECEVTGDIAKRFEAANAGIKIVIENPTTVRVDGADKEIVGQVAAEIRQVRPPEPYKGKGIRYQGEQVRRKAGKTGAK